MAYETILYEVKGNVAYVTMNRPAVLNAANQKMHEERADAWSRAKEDPEVRVVILNGAGRAFSSGADVRGLGGGGDVPLVERRRSRDLDSQNLVNLDKPVIAAIQGYCLGNGLETALRCDIRIAAEDARFGTYEIRVGILPAGGAHYRLTQLVGVGKAMEIILTANPVEAQEALRIGLVNQVVPLDQLMASATAMATVIASRAPVAIRLAKEAIRRGIGLSEEQALRIEGDLGNFASTTEDSKEGPRAFAEKREPVWKGR